VDDVIKSLSGPSTVSTYSYSVLRSHTMFCNCSRSFSHAVISQLTYAAPAWWGFSTSTDRLRVETFLRRAAPSGLWESATTTLMMKVCIERFCVLSLSVLDELLPPKSDVHHNFRKQRHDRSNVACKERTPLC